MADTLPGARKLQGATGMGVGAATVKAVQPDGRCVVHLFGHSRLDIDGAELAIRGPIKRGLVAMLALDLGHAVHVDRLVDGLWDEDRGRDVLQSLRVHISQLRTLFDDEVQGARHYVEGRYPLYRLSADVTSDFARASALRDRALDRLAEDPEEALRDLDAARRLVREEPLAEVLHLPFARFAVDFLRAFQLQLADDYAEVATAAWGSLAPGAVVTPGAPGADPSRATPMDERRWRLFTRLADATPDAATPGELQQISSRGRLRAQLRSVPDRPGDGPVPTELPSELAARAPAVFVGRQRERAALLELSASVERDHQTQIAHVVGPGGVGKTSLAAAVAQDLAAAGTVVLYASWAGPALAAHAPFVTAGLINPRDETGGTNPPLGQDALAAEVIDRLRELGDRPVALILDDLHRLPARYHSVLLRVLECPDLAMLAVLLQRTEPGGRDLEDALPTAVQRIRLRPFSEQELGELAGMLGEAPGPVTGHRLPWVAGLLLAAPGDVADDRIGEAVEQLWGGDREMLEKLALAPDGLMLRTLQHNSGFTPVESLDRLRRLVAAGLATELNSRPPRFVIAHELVADAVRDRAGPATWIERSAALHEALCATGAPIGERVPHAIAGADLLGERADETVMLAAQVLVRTGAFADTIALAEAAQEAGVGCAARSGIVVDAARLFGQAALGERNDVAGRLLDLAQDAADLEEWETATTVLQWRTRLGVGDPQVGRLLESALSAVSRAHPRLRFEILWCLVFHVMFADGRISQAARLVDEMVRIGDELRDLSLRTRALFCSHWLLAAQGASPETLDAVSDTITKYAEATGDEQLIAGAHASRIGNAIRAHRLDAIEPHADVLRRARDPHTSWRAQLIEAMLELDALDLASAEASIARASTFARERGLIIRGDEAMAQSFVLAWARGSLADVRELLEVLKPNALGQQGWLAALALARLASGDDEGAVALGIELADATESSVANEDWYSIIAAALLTDVAMFTRSAPLAQHVVEQLSRRSGGRVHLGLAVDLGPVDRYLALAHSTLGSDHEAERLRVRARSQAGCPLWESRLDQDELATGRIIPATAAAWSWIETAPP